MEKKDNKSLGVYVHIPFCARKCNYCDFLSWNRDKDMQEAYMNALISEIKLNSYRFKEYEVATIYIGGGTPSFVDSKFICEVLDNIYKCYDVEEDAEITIEVNPGTLDSRKINDYKRAGINRVSMGLQSTDNDELKMLGRIHTYEEFLDNYKAIQEVGIDNISVDLMFAIPNQTLESYRKSLERIVELKPSHISSYSLIIEEGTWFYNNQDKLKLVSEDEERHMYYMTNDILKNNGYERYEISNYSLKGMESRHNSSYWIGTDYVGFGLGASSYVDGVRFDRIRDMDQYIKSYSGVYNLDCFSCSNVYVDFENKLVNIEKDVICNRNILSNNDKIEEFMFLGLRMTKGISIEQFKTRFKKDIFNIYGHVIRKYKDVNLLEYNDKKIWLTEKGLDVSNTIFSDFLL